MHARPLWLQKHTIYAHTSTYTVPNCDIALGWLTLPATEAEYPVELILLHIYLKVTVQENWPVEYDLRYDTVANGMSCNSRMTSVWWFGIYIQGSGCVLFEVPFLYFLRLWKATKIQVRIADFRAEMRDVRFSLYDRIRVSLKCRVK